MATLIFNLPTGLHLPRHSRTHQQYDLISYSRSTASSSDVLFFLPHFNSITVLIIWSRELRLQKKYQNTRTRELPARPWTLVRAQRVRLVNGYRPLHDYRSSPRNDPRTERSVSFFMNSLFVRIYSLNEFGINLTTTSFIVQIPAQQRHATSRFSRRNRRTVYSRTRRLNRIRFVGSFSLVVAAKPLSAHLLLPEGWGGGIKILSVLPSSLFSQNRVFAVTRRDDVGVVDDHITRL